eukprot:9102172-Prorocentrum_lima.AAC.1
MTQSGLLLLEALDTSVPAMRRDASCVVRANHMAQSKKLAQQIGRKTLQYRKDNKLSEVSCRGLRGVIWGWSV